MPSRIQARLGAAFASAAVIAAALVGAAPTAHALGDPTLAPPPLPEQPDATSELVVQSNPLVVGKTGTAGASAASVSTTATTTTASAPKRSISWYPNAT